MAVRLYDMQKMKKKTRSQVATENRKKKRTPWAEQMHSFFVKRPDTTTYVLPVARQKH
jgi:hypothetical protein